MISRDWSFLKKKFIYEEEQQLTREPDTLTIDEPPRVRNMFMERTGAHWTM